MIDYTEFCEVLQCDPSPQGERLFQLFDYEKRGQIDVREFMIALSNFTGAGKDDSVSLLGSRRWRLHETASPGVGRVFVQIGVGLDVTLSRRESDAYLLGGEIARKASRRRRSGAYIWPGDGGARPTCEGRVVHDLEHRTSRPSRSPWPPWRFRLPLSNRDRSAASPLRCGPRGREPCCDDLAQRAVEVACEREACAPSCSTPTGAHSGVFRNGAAGSSRT